MDSSKPLSLVASTTPVAPRRSLAGRLIGALFFTSSILGVGCAPDGRPGDEPEADATPATPAVSHAVVRSAARCPSCEVRNTAVLELPETGARVVQAKLFDPETGSFRAVAVDSEGRAVDVEALRQDEERAVRARRGALTEELHQKVARLDPEELVPIYVWVSVPISYPAKESMTDESMAAFERETDAEVERRKSAVIADLAARGVHVASHGANTPLVEGWAPARVAGGLRDLPGATVVGTSAQAEQAMFTWAFADKLESAHTAGGSGNGTKVCVLEWGYPTDLSLLSGITTFASPTQTPTDTHADNVTGIVRSAFVRDLQMAPQAEILICGYGGTISGGYPRCEHWCAGNGANTITMSSMFAHASYLNESDMQFDWLTKRYPYPTTVVAAGNDASFVQNRGHNELVVGAADDKGTQSVSDDAIAGFSNWRNPSEAPHHDRELPHLVAPGVNVTAAGYTMSGTSMATPQVAGTVSMMQGMDGRFKSWPEMSRASILATAVHNVDASPIDRLGSGDLVDGVGLLNASYAVSLASTSNWKIPGSAASFLGRHARTLTPSDFGTTGRLNDTYTISTATSGRLRVVITWDSSVNCDATGVNCTADTLDADLDLEIKDQLGNVVCSSSSYDNSWEICDIPVSSSGLTYTAKPVKYSFSAANTYFSIAWFNYNPAWD